MEPRKRHSERQISKDDAPDEEAEEETMGTWQRADEATLAARKIRKVKRPNAGSSATNARTSSNAFSSIQLAPPAAANPFAAVQLTASSSPAPLSTPSFSFGATPAPAADVFTFGSTAPPPAPVPPAAAPPSFGGSAEATGAFTFGAQAVDVSQPPSSIFGTGSSAGAGQVDTPAPLFGATASPPSTAAGFIPPPASLAAPAGGGPFGLFAAPASEGNAVVGAPLPASVFCFGAPASAEGSFAAPADVVDSSGQNKVADASVGSSPSSEEVVALNKAFLAWLEGEWAAGRDIQTADWSSGMLDYIEQRAALRSNSKPSPAAPATLFGAPAMTSTAKFGSSVNPSAPTGLFGGVGSTSASLDNSQAATAPPEAAVASSTPAGSRVETSVRGGEDADVRWKGMVKLSVYRVEKKSDQGELIQDAGWKPVGRGLLRVLHDAGIFFIEFRPEVSEGQGGDNQEPEEEVSNSKQRLGRAVLSARIKQETRFDVNKKSVQCNLASMDASGAPNFARYNIPMETPQKAQEFVDLVRKCMSAA